MSNKILDTRVADIVWFPEHNVSRCASGMSRNSEGDKKLALSMARGYDSTIGGSIAVRKATTEETKEGIQLRKVYLDALKSVSMDAEPDKVKIGEETILINSSDMVRIAESLFVDDKGKIIPPKYVGVTGYRRGANIAFANAIAAKSGQEGVKNLPVVIREYANTKEQIIDNIRENTGKTEGAVRPGLADNIGAAKRLYQLGASPADIGRAFGLNRGATQKFAEVCKLDKAYPDLKIVDRIMSGELENAKSYTYSKVNALLKDGASEEEVEDFLQNPTDKAPKSMKRPDIVRIMDQCPVTLVKMVCLAILKDDASYIEKYVLAANAVNKAVNDVVEWQEPEAMATVIAQESKKK